MNAPTRVVVGCLALCCVPAAAPAQTEGIPPPPRWTTTLGLGFGAEDVYFNGEVGQYELWVPLVRYRIDDPLFLADLGLNQEVVVGYVNSGQRFIGSGENTYHMIFGGLDLTRTWRWGILSGGFHAGLGLGAAHKRELASPGDRYVGGWTLPGALGTAGARAGVWRIEAGADLYVQSIRPRVAPVASIGYSSRSVGGAVVAPVVITATTAVILYVLSRVLWSNVEIPIF